MFWKWIPREDYITGAAKPRTLPRGVTPIGARFTDQRTPDTTIQMIGDPGASVPDVDVDLGVSDIFIRNQAQDITFGGSGLMTNVGEGVDSPAMGMTVNGGAGISRPAMTDYYPPHSVSRPAIAKTDEPLSGEIAVRGINRPKIAEDTRKMVEETYEEPLAAEPEEILAKPKTATSEDDFSDLIELSGSDMDDIFGTSERPKKRPVNRVRMRSKQPRRGTDDTQIMIRRLRQ